MHYPVITISREYGSGGRAIGERLAKELGVPFYDKELIFMAAKESGLSEEYIKKTEQMKSTAFSMACNIERPAAAHERPNLFGAEQDHPPGGPGGALRDRRPLRGTMSCGTEGPAEQFSSTRRWPSGRTGPRRSMRKRPGNMEDFVRKKDKKRAAFYNYFSQNKWGDARHYHLAISSVYGVDFAVEVLKHAAESFPGGTEK